MARRRVKEEQVRNSESWLSTFADLITLLMVFFILLYSMSEVDKNKFKAVAEQLNVAMGGRSLAGTTDSGSNGLLKDMPDNPEADLDDTLDKLGKIIEDNGISSLAYIHKDERGIVISLNEKLLFNLGSADVGKESQKILKKIAETLSKLSNYIRVEGFTDNIPIRTEEYPSNWELASHRAINVAKILIKNGIKAEMLSTASYGEYRPAFLNDNEENRRLNRRVDIVVIKTELNKLEPKIK